MKLKHYNPKTTPKGRKSKPVISFRKNGHSVLVEMSENQYREWLSRKYGK